MISQRLGRELSGNTVGRICTGKELCLRTLVESGGGRGIRTLGTVLRWHQRSVHSKAARDMNWLGQRIPAPRWNGRRWRRLARGVQCWATIQGSSGIVFAYRRESRLPSTGFLTRLPACITFVWDGTRLTRRLMAFRSALSERVVTGFE